MRVGSFNRTVQLLTLLMLWLTSVLGLGALALVITARAESGSRLLGLAALVTGVALVTTFLLIRRWTAFRQRKRERERAREKIPVTHLPSGAYKPKPPLFRVKRTKR